MHQVALHGYIKTGLIMLVAASANCARHEAALEP